MSYSFVTDQGVEVPAVTAGQMREIDRIAIEETGPNLYQMMENAGRNLALTAIEMLGEEWRDGSILVMAGPGGNGGGGICAARHLANRGAGVAVVLSAAERLGEVPRQQLDVYGASGGRIIAPSEVGWETPALVIDALIGYSLTGPLRSSALDLALWGNDVTAPVLSLDLPSGLDSTTGEAEGAVVMAMRTMTLALPKTGLGGEPSGDLLLADIGIPGETYRRAGLEVAAEVFGESYTVAIRPLS